MTIGGGAYCPTLSTAPTGGTRNFLNADISVTRSSTRDNAGFLSPVFLAHIEASLGGTQLGRQELEGEFIDVEDGVFWTRAMLEAARAGALPDTFADVVVAVDPPVSIGPDADACGLVAAGTANAPGGGAHLAAELQ